MTPLECVAALEAALSQNPHLTSLPTPKPDLLAPEGLTLTTGTGEIFRFLEVQAAITGDFVVLPCDLVCELGGDALLESWMIEEGGFGNAADSRQSSRTANPGVRTERGRRRGGLSVWYATAGQGSIKGEETDFLVTTPLPAPLVQPPIDSLRPRISQLVYCAPSDTLDDQIEADKSLLIRHSLIRKYGRVRLISQKRDAHIYFFPYWVMEMIKRNKKFDSISEDVLGWWAKAGWQHGLADKLGLKDVLSSSSASSLINGGLKASESVQDDIDLASMSTTWTSRAPSNTAYALPKGKNSSHFASRVGDTAALESSDRPGLSGTEVPSILAYIHTSLSTSPLIRRVDTIDLLLAVSLRLARLPSLEEAKGDTTPSPFAHAAKVAYTGGVAQKSTITKGDCLLAENVTVREKAVIKESVIGANCEIGSGARLTKCLLMDGVVVEESCVLSGCVLGRRSKVGKKSELKDCRVQEGFAVPEESTFHVGI